MNGLTEQDVRNCPVLITETEGLEVLADDGDTEAARDEDTNDGEEVGDYEVAEEIDYNGKFESVGDIANAKDGDEVEGVADIEDVDDVRNDDDIQDVQEAGDEKDIEDDGAPSKERFSSSSTSKNPLTS